MKLLLITPHFPSPDFYAERSKDPRTKFLLDYADAWTKQGHNVRVLHLPPRYPKVFNWFAGHFAQCPIIRSLQLSRFRQNRTAISAKNYSSANIDIVRHPFPKYVPHRPLPMRRLHRLNAYLLQRCKDEKWQADFILADYIMPSLPIGIELAQHLQASLFLILHQTDFRYFLQSTQPQRLALSKCTALLFRSTPMAERFKAAGVTSMPHDLLYSGLPDEVVSGVPRRHITRLLYVGTLRRSKNVHMILHSLGELRRKHPTVELTVVGSGEYESVLRTLAGQLGLLDSVRFIGKVPYDKVFEYMRKADSLVMVSRESFGMVYVEAMSQGCIVVAAKGEGIDGIVKHGDNGFLVPLHDQQALTETLDNICVLPPDEVERVSHHAIQTADELRNDLLASNTLTRLQKYR